MLMEFKLLFVFLYYDQIHAAMYLTNVKNDYVDFGLERMRFVDTIISKMPFYCNE